MAKEGFKFNKFYRLKTLLLLLYLIQTPFDIGGIEPYHQAISTFIILSFWFLNIRIRMPSKEDFIIRFTLNVIFVTIFLFFIGISIITSVDKSVSVWLYIQWVNNGLFLLALYNHIVHRDAYLKIINSIIFPLAGVMSIWGLYHYFTGNSVYAGGTNEYRALAMFNNPNSLAGYLGIVITILSAKYLNEIVRKNKIIFFALLMLISAGFIAAQSRAGLISLLIGMTIYLILVGWRTIRKQWVHLMFIILGFSAIFFSLTTYRSTAVQRMQSIIGSDYMEEGLEGRIDLWMSAQQIAKDHPFFGTGIGTFHLMLPSKSSIARDHVESMAHSDYVQFLSEIGFIGTISFIIALIVYLSYGFELIKKFKRTEGHHSANENLLIGIYAASIIPIVHSIVDYDLRTPGVLALFLFLSSFIWHEADRAGLIPEYSMEFKKSKGFQDAMKLIGVLLAIVVVTFISVTVVSDYYYKKALKSEENKDYLSGIEFANKAISLRSTISNYHNFKARNYYRLGLLMPDSASRNTVLRESEREFLVAMNLSSMITHNYIGLASLYETNNELFDSSSHKIALLYDKARILSPANNVIRYNFAEILLKAGLYDRAIEALEGAVGRGSQLENALTLLAEAYRHSGDAERAGLTIDKKLIEDPIDGFANFVKGNILIDLEKSDEAVTYYVRALEKSKGENRIDVLKRLAMTYWDKGDAERAAEYLNEILNERPNEKLSSELLKIIRTDQAGPDPDNNGSLNLID